MTVFKTERSDFFYFISVPWHAQSIHTGPGASLCSCSGLSLPSRPHSLSLLTIPKQDQESLSAPCHTVSARQGPLPGQLAQCRHRTVTPDPGLVNPESFMEASRSAGALRSSNSFSSYSDPPLSPPASPSFLLLLFLFILLLLLQLLLLPLLLMLFLFPLPPCPSLPPCS